MDLIVPNDIHWVAVSAGYVFAVIVGHRGTRTALVRMPLSEAERHGQPGIAYHTELGLVERAIYASAVLMGHAEVGGALVWLEGRQGHRSGEGADARSLQPMAHRLRVVARYGVAGGLLAKTAIDGASIFEWAWPSLVPMFLTVLLLAWPRDADPTLDRL